MTAGPASTLGLLVAEVREGQVPVRHHHLLTGGLKYEALSVYFLYFQLLECFAGEKKLK